MVLLYSRIWKGQGNNMEFSHMTEKDPADLD